MAVNHANLRALKRLSSCTTALATVPLLYLTAMGLSVQAAKAACVASGSDYTCSGTTTTSRTFEVDNATFTTMPGFSAPSIQTYGKGSYKYIDTNNSTLSGSVGTHTTGSTRDAGLAFWVNGDSATAKASVDINANGKITGKDKGIYVYLQNGTGSVNINVQAGLDGLVYESEQGKLIGGVTLHYSHGSADIRSSYDADQGGGKISTDGYGFGGTLTWYGENGFYVDSQAQASWYNSDLSFAGGNKVLTGGNDGLGYGLSLEGGQRIALDAQWSLTPQAQLVYSNVDFDDFTDAFGSAVSLGKGDSLQGRLGLAVEYQASWQNERGLTDRANIYGIGNLDYEFLDGTRVDVAGVSLANEKENLWGGVGAGGSYSWDDGKYALYGEGTLNTSLTNFGDSYTLKGNVGLRLKW